MARTLLLLRHAETALNLSGALRGRLDVPLSDHGVWEARRLAERVATEYAVQAVYSSPLSRARATAEAVAERGGVDVLPDERFIDLDYGGWAGRLPDTFSTLETEEWRRWLRHPEVPLNGAEKPLAAQRRARAALEELGAAGEGCIAIVTHDAILQLLLCDLLSIHLQSYRGLVQHTATLNEVAGSRDGWRVRLLNSTWHLDNGESLGPVSFARTR